MNGNSERGMSHYEGYYWGHAASLGMIGGYPRCVTEDDFTDVRSRKHGIQGALLSRSIVLAECREETTTARLVIVGGLVRRTAFLIDPRTSITHGAIILRTTNYQRLRLLLKTPTSI